MNRLQSTRDRYLRDSMPVRLGGVASNLERIHALAADPALCEVAGGVLLQTALFIDWAAPDAALEEQETLLEVQRALARWRRHVAPLWADAEKRERVGRDAREMSERVLALSGLADGPR